MSSQQLLCFPMFKYWNSHDNFYYKFDLFLFEKIASSYSLINVFEFTAPVSCV